jgi:hypothetical protein
MTGMKVRYMDYEEACYMARYMDMARQCATQRCVTWRVTHADGAR